MMQHGTLSSLAALFAGGVAICAIAGSVLAQVPIDPSPKEDCPESENCYSFPCPGNCVGSNITCTNSNHIACCCTTAGTSTCSCKTLTACESPPAGTVCRD